MKKPDLRTVKTRSLLASSLIDLMDRTPFDEIKVVDICQGAQVHRTTFYKHFEDKYQLLKYVVDGLLEELKSTLVSLDSDTDSADYYCAILEAVIRYIHDNEKKFRSIIKNNTSGLFIHTLQNIISSHMEGFMHSLEEKGYTFDMPVPLLARYHSGGLLASAYYLLDLGKDQYTVDEMCRYLCTIARITSCIKKN